MTQAIGGAPQSHGMADKPVRTSPSHTERRAQHADAANADASADRDEASVAKERHARESRARHTTSSGSPAKSEFLLSLRDAGGQGKDDGKEDTFAATIDGLDSKTQQPTGEGKPSADTSDMTIWNAGAAFAQIALARLSGDDPGTTASPKSAEGASARRAEGSKGAGALSDAGDRIVAKHTDMPTDAMHEDTLTANVTVNARETHWLFADRKTVEAGATVAHADRSAAGKIAPHEALAAKAQDMMQKPSAAGERPAAGVSMQEAAASAAPRRQAFDGQRDSGSRSREQSGGASDDRRSSALGAAGKTERAALDTTAPTTGMPGATQQLKTGILNALTGSSGHAAAPRGTPFQTTEERPTMAGQVLRVIDITLSPPDLGTVKLRLTLQSNALAIDAEASKASTAKLLNDDRKGLEQSLRDSGYDVSSLKIADASASNSTNLNGGSNPQDGGQPRANFAGRQDGDQQHRNGTPSDQSQHRSSGERSDRGTNEAAKRQTSGIYI